MTAPARLVSPIGVVLWDGGVTDAARETYSMGDCWALAWALAKLSGGQLVALRSTTDWHHLAVRLGEDVYLDVFGLHSEAALRAAWPGELELVPSWASATLDAYKIDYLDAWWEFEPGMATVEAFAKLLLADVASAL